MPDWRGEHRRRPVGSDGNAEVPAILLLDTRDVDDPDLEVGRSGIDGRQIDAWIDPIDLPPELLVEAVHRPAGSDFHFHASVGRGRRPATARRSRGATISSAFRRAAVSENLLSEDRRRHRDRLFLSHGIEPSSELSLLLSEPPRCPRVWRVRQASGSSGNSSVAACRNSGCSESCISHRA